MPIIITRLMRCWIHPKIIDPRIHPKIINWRIISRIFRPRIENWMRNRRGNSIIKSQGLWLIGEFVIDCKGGGVKSIFGGGDILFGNGSILFIFLFLILAIFEVLNCRSRIDLLFWRFLFIIILFRLLDMAAPTAIIARIVIMTATIVIQVPSFTELLLSSSNSETSNLPFVPTFSPFSLRTVIVGSDGTVAFHHH